MYKIPKYINKPLQFLGLELIDVVAIYAVILIVWIAKSWLYFLCLTAIVAKFIHLKKKNPQGFFKHILYFLGRYELDHYPAFSEQEFLE